MKDNEKLLTHKGGCPKCFAAEKADDLCRNGRRIFVSWFRGMPEEQKVMYLSGMPKDLQDSILELTETEGILMGLPEAQN